MATYTKGELNFINEMTRKHLADWADAQLITGELPQSKLKGLDPYVEHAVAKGWLSKATPHRVSSKGYQTAGAYLRR